MSKDIEITLSECFHPKNGKPNLRKIPVGKVGKGRKTEKGHGKRKRENGKGDRFIFHHVTGD